jgi:hypothetical protein
MLNLGKVKPGTTLYIPFDTFGTNGESLTMSGLAAGDIKVYKDGGTTERASTSGFTLLDTDGIDFDALTGIHGVSISLADNTTAGFWAAGSKYFVVIDSITVNTQTVRFVVATFEIAIEGAVLSTTIATLSSQTSFTLTDGPAEDDALNGCVMYAHDVASAVQGGYAYVSDYTGATKTVTLVAGPTFTMAATDNVGFFPPIQVFGFGGTAGTFSAGRPEVNTTHAAGTAWGSGAITAASIAANAINAAKLDPDVTTELQSGLATAAALDTVDNFLDTEVAAILAAVDTEVAAIKAVTDLLPDAGALSSLATQASVNTIDDFLDTEIATLITQTGAAAIRTALGLASANLDTQLDALPTTAEVLTQVNAALDTAIAELGVAAPTATPTLRTGLMLLYMALRNKTTSTATQATISNNAGTTIATAAQSDDTVTYEKGEFA